MRSFGKLFIFGILPLFISISSPYQLTKPRNLRCTQTPKVVTIEQVTEPVQHAEGPHWDHRSGKLYFVDIHEQMILRLDIQTGRVSSVYIDNGPVGYVIPVEDSIDQFVAGAGTDLVLVRWDSEDNSTDSITQVLTTVDTDRNGTRFNDAKADSHGRLWAGTIGHEDESGVDPEQGSLYKITYESSERMISPVSISNGLAWNTADNKLYYIDTPTRKISSFDFDSDAGTISNRTTVFDLANSNITGMPDGMTIDIDNNLWIALFKGGRVINVDPRTGKLLQAIEIPANQVTSVTFGGPMLDTLYVTTSRFGLNKTELEAQPRAGSVFAVKGLGVKGLAANSFATRKIISNIQF